MLSESVQYQGKAGFFKSNIQISISQNTAWQLSVNYRQAFAQIISFYMAKVILLWL